MSFSELRLSEPIVRAIALQGYQTPTPIQAKAIPHILAAADVLGCAQTGTGKTGAFAMPILHRLHASADGPSRRLRKGAHHGSPRALVLCPTRELATQIFESFRTYGQHAGLRHCVVFGGVNQGRQVRSLQSGVDVLVATPGRLLDLMEQGFIDLSAVEILVLDEADRMLDMGFIKDIRKVVDRMPTKRQTLLFSATMPGEIRALADSILHKPVMVQVAPVASTAQTITQQVYHVSRGNKPRLIERLLNERNMGRTLIFTRTKFGADKLAKLLFRSGIGAEAIHGNKNQNARTRALAGFKSGRTPVLVATDIASRGIDVDDVRHVINYDMPHEPETYVHRIGRTARAGASGVAISFCDAEEVNDLRAIQRLTDIELTVMLDAADLSHQAPQFTADRQKSQSAAKSAKRRRSRRPRAGKTARPAAAAGKHRGKSRRKSFAS